MLRLREIHRKEPEEYSGEQVSDNITIMTLDWVNKNSKPLMELYGQATQDGCSLALCTFPAPPISALPTLSAHNWPLVHTCPRPQLVIVPIKGVGRGLAHLLVSLVTNKPTWHQFLLYMAISPFPARSKDLHHVLPVSHHTWWGVAPGPCFRHVTFQHPLNHWCLCHWHWSLSSVLNLGKYRPCRPMCCSPTENLMNL